MKNKFLLFLFFTAQCYGWWPFFPAQKPYIVLLDAAGNPRNPGRAIDNNFEQTITLTIAQQLQQRIMQEMPWVQVYLNRNEREITDEFQTANLANKIDADFVVSIHCYQEQSIKPSVYIYHFSYGQQNMSNTDKLAFVPYDQAHLKNFKKSELYSHIILKTLTKPEYITQFDCKGVFSIPFKPLIGITSPALGIEIGLKSKDDWKKYITPLFFAFQKVIEQ